MAQLVSSTKSPAAIERESHVWRMETFSPELATAIALHRAGRLPEAERLYRQLLGHVSQGARAHSALGVLLSTQGRFAEARRHHQHVVEALPQDFLAHKLLGDACSEEGDIDASRQHYRNAARANGDSWLWHLRADIVSPLVYDSNQAIDASRSQLAARIESYRSAPLQLDLDELIATGCKPPLALAYQGRDDRSLKEQFASIFAERLPADLPRAGSGKPHLGFVVTEGNEGVFLRGMAGVVRHLDLRQFQITIACSRKAEGKMRSAIGREINYLHLFPRLFDSVGAVRAARFDLLYFWEIGTDCLNYYLPFFRLAPVQCTSWGWPTTSGIGEVDYFLSSKLLEPAGADEHYSEQLVEFNHLPNYYEPISTAGLDNDRESLGISDSQHLYFCGQNPRKLHPDFDAILGRILRCDARGTVALVKSSKPAMTAALRRRMEKTLPDCVDRIRWLPRMTQADYLRWMAVADCVLDTPHYSGGANTTCDAFTVGAPVVTLRGEFHRGRYTAAAYAAMGMHELVADNVDQYVDRALRLTAEKDFNRQMRREIARCREVLFENLAAVQELQGWFLNAIAQTR